MRGVPRRGGGSAPSVICFANATSLTSEGGKGLWQSPPITCLCEACLQAVAIRNIQSQRNGFPRAVNRPRNDVGFLCHCEVNLPPAFRGGVPRQGRGEHASPLRCHCEERSDVAIRNIQSKRNGFPRAVNRPRNDVGFSVIARKFCIKHSKRTAGTKQPFNFTGRDFFRK